MTPRQLLTDLRASAPADAIPSMERASDAFDAGDMDTAAGTLFAVSRAGQTSWHERAASLADDIDWQEERRQLEASLTQATEEDWTGVLS